MHHLAMVCRVSLKHLLGYPVHWKLEYASAVYDLCQQLRGSDASFFHLLNICCPNDLSVSPVNMYVITDYVMAAWDGLDFLIGLLKVRIIYVFYA